jgi:hypothetical protein
MKEEEESLNVDYSYNQWSSSSVLRRFNREQVTSFMSILKCYNFLSGNTR